MRLFKKDNINDYIIPKDLSIGATGMLNSLLIRTNDELENTDLYSLSNDSRKDVALDFLIKNFSLIWSYFLERNDD